MAKCRILFGADLHLKRRIWANRPQIVGDVEYAIDQLVDRIRDTKPDVVVLGGDIFNDPRPSSADLELFSRLLEPKVPVGFIMGNHDTCEPPWPLALKHKSLFYLAAEEMLVKGVRIAGINSMPPDLFPEAVEKAYGGISAGEKHPEVLVIHQTFSDFFSYSTLPIASLSPFKGHVVLAGDYHMKLHKTYTTPGEVGVSGMTFLSPGSLYATKSDEIHRQHGLWLLEVDGSGMQGITYVPILGRLFLTEMEQWDHRYVATCPLPPVWLGESAPPENMANQMIVVPPERDLEKVRAASTPGGREDLNAVVNETVDGMAVPVRADPGYTRQMCKDLWRDPSLTMIEAWKKKVIGG